MVKSKRCCKNCKKLESCGRPIRLMVSKEDLEHIVCIEYEDLTLVDKENYKEEPLY